jgi:hypothetical protein
MRNILESVVPVEGASCTFKNWATSCAALGRCMDINLSEERPETVRSLSISTWEGEIEIVFKRG